MRKNCTCSISSEVACNLAGAHNPECMTAMNANRLQRQTTHRRTHTPDEEESRLWAVRGTYLRWLPHNESWLRHKRAINCGTPPWPQQTASTDEYSMWHALTKHSGLVIWSMRAYHIGKVFPFPSTHIVCSAHGTYTHVPHVTHTHTPRTSGWTDEEQKLRAGAQLLSVLF